MPQFAASTLCEARLAIVKVWYEASFAHLTLYESESGVPFEKRIALPPAATGTCGV